MDGYQSRNLYSATQVCEVVGITYRCLDYWVRVGLLDPCRQAQGSGTRRMFDERDVADARLAALLMSVRHDTIWAGRVVEAVRTIGLADWAHHEIVIHPNGTVEVDGAVTTIAVVVNLGSLVASSDAVAA